MTQQPQDSLQTIAASIARGILVRLRVPDSEAAITETVRKALQVEARGSELNFAYVRVAFLAGLTLLNLASLAIGWPIPVLNYPVQNTLVAMTWLGLAIGLMSALRKGWYRGWLRRAVPLTDALMIVSSFALLRHSLRLEWTTWETGVVVGAAAACLLVAFSGSLRLSRSAAINSTTVALLSWLAIALIDNAGSVAVGFIAATILAVGGLGTRFTRVVRRVVSNEVARVRLEAMYEDAHREVVARREVLEVVSHDLRNPLNIIAMSTDLLLELKPGEEERVKRLGVIQRAGEHMDRLIHDLLDVTRIEEHKLVVEPTPVSVSRIVNDVLELMRPLAAGKQLSLLAVYDEGLPRVHADHERIVQVFSNLIGNAIKFTPTDGRIVIKADRVGDKIRFAVIDSGRGIPPDQLSRIFDRYWQPRQSDQRGIGLGLTIARGIVEAHGERIGVQSRLGEGTELWFNLPIAPAREVSS